MQRFFGTCLLTNVVCLHVREFWSEFSFIILATHTSFVFNSFIHKTIFTSKYASLHLQAIQIYLLICPFSCMNILTSCTYTIWRLLVLLGEGILFSTILSWNMDFSLECTFNKLCSLKIIVAKDIFNSVNIGSWCFRCNYQPLYHKPCTLFLAVTVFNRKYFFSWTHRSLMLQ